MSEEIIVKALMNDLRTEIRRARAKFPNNDRLTLALMEEVGELANAILEHKDARTEALHVACVAMRIYLEGDATYTRIGVQL